jgi:uncharacterized metal-binding protein YceD (DUF177 family)
MIAPESHPQRLRVAHLNPNAANSFHLRPGEQPRLDIAAELGLDGLTRLDFQGNIRGEGREGWVLTGKLQARVTQPCVVSLKPVRTDIAEDVRIRFTPHMPKMDGEEAEMLDDTLEPLGSFIDLTAIMVEALSLALPQYPRAKGAQLASDTPEADDEPAGDTRRPFAGLEGLLRDSKRES